MQRSLPISGQAIRRLTAALLTLAAARGLTLASSPQAHAAGEEQRLNDTADLLNGLLGSVASAHGFGFANPTGAFIGHAVCDSPEWINGLSNPISDSYHPNQSGHASGYGPAAAKAHGINLENWIAQHT